MSQMQERYPNLKRGSSRGRLSTAASRAKACYLDVFEKLGGATALLEWVQEDAEHKKLFYGWIVRMLPRELDVTARNDVTFSPRDLAVRAARAIVEREISQQEEHGAPGTTVLPTPPA